LSEYTFIGKASKHRTLLYVATPLPYTIISHLLQPLVQYNVLTCTNTTELTETHIHKTQIYEFISSDCRIYSPNYQTNLLTTSTKLKVEIPSVKS